jgi:hypothetical protein
LVAEIERGLGVTRVYRKRAFEVVFGLSEVAACVADDPQHVVDVGETLAVLEHLAQQGLSLLELTLLVVLAA